MTTLNFALFLLVGHFFGAYMFYFFHRYIFHGSLGKYPVLKQWRRIHTQHHGSPEDPGAFFFPWWANLSIWLFAGLLSLVSIGFSLGLISFFIFYAFKHRAAHLGAKTFSGKHHRYHHYGKPSANFSGAYPFIDKLFGTYVPVPVNSKRKNQL